MTNAPKSRDIFIVAHPDDAEVMFGYKISTSENPWVLVASNGAESTVDLIGGGFVKSGKRLDESRRGLEHYNVPLAQQCYLDLPDGELDEYIPQIRDTVLEMIGSCGLRSLVSFGHDGFDGHPDHQAMHYATLAAAQEHSGTGDVLTLDSSHNGLHIVRGDITQKLGAMAFHESQFDLANPYFWPEFAQYVPLITQGETYNRVLAA